MSTPVATIVAAATAIIENTELPVPRDNLSDLVQTLVECCEDVEEEQYVDLLLETRAFEAIGSALSQVKFYLGRNYLNRCNYEGALDWIQQFHYEYLDFAEDHDPAHGNPKLEVYWESIEDEYYDSDAARSVSSTCSDWERYLTENMFK